MPQSSRLLLPDERNVRHIGDGLQLLKLLGLAALFQPLVVFERVVEMVFNRFLVPPRDDEDVRDAGGDGLLHQILDGGLVHNRQHFLRHALGDRKHTGAQSGSRNDGLCYFHNSFSNRSFPEYAALPQIFQYTNTRGGGRMLTGYYSTSAFGIQELFPK